MINCLSVDAVCLLSLRANCTHQPAAPQQCPYSGPRRQQIASLTSQPRPVLTATCKTNPAGNFTTNYLVSTGSPWEKRKSKPQQPPTTHTHTPPLPSPLNPSTPNVHKQAMTLTNMRLHCISMVDTSTAQPLYLYSAQTQTQTHIHRQIHTYCTQSCTNVQYS